MRPGGYMGAPSCSCARALASRNLRARVPTVHTRHTCMPPQGYQEPARWRAWSPHAAGLPGTCTLVRLQSTHAAGLPGRRWYAQGNAGHQAVACVE